MGELGFAWGELDFTRLFRTDKKTQNQNSEFKKFIRSHLLHRK